MSSAGSVRSRSFLADGVSAARRATQASPAMAAPPLGLEGLFQNYYASIWRLLRRFGVKAEQVDDAAQEVFWVAARRLPDIQPGSEHAFLYGVALRVASNLLRQQRSQPPTEEEALSHLVDQRPSPEELLEQRQARALLDSVLDRLPLELRTVFVLFELEGLEVRHIAEIEGIPVGTASSRLRRAREEFSAAARRVRAALATHERRR